jgi:pyruvate formate lyase activating enzyme
MESKGGEKRMSSSVTRREFIWEGIFLTLGLCGIYLFSRWQKYLSTSLSSSLRKPMGRKASFPQLKEAMFYQSLPGGKIKCELCFRRCLVKEGGIGFCRVRKNIGGRYYSLVWNSPAALQIDPVEKEPQYHFLPGTDILCFGTAGCNFRCRHCHNWHLSQAKPEEISVYQISPEEAVKIALLKKIPTISFTYNEPTVFYEYVYEIAKLAQSKGIKIMWHTNGALLEGPLRELLKYTDAVTVDLKGFSKKAYQNSEGLLAPVLKTLKIIKTSGKWLEIVNLVIPTLNDELNEIKAMCKWIKENLGVEVPLHFSRFFPQYKLTHVPATPLKTLEASYQMAKEIGLYYVTLGNVPGHKYNSTFCPACGEKIIHRRHFQVLSFNIMEGKCKFCQFRVAGVFS